MCEGGRALASGATHTHTHTHTHTQGLLMCEGGRALASGAMYSCVPANLCGHVISIH